VAHGSIHFAFVAVDRALARERHQRHSFSSPRFKTDRRPAAKSNAFLRGSAVETSADWLQRNDSGCLLDGAVPTIAGPLPAPGCEAFNPLRRRRVYIPGIAWDLLLNRSCMVTSFVPSGNVASTWTRGSSRDAIHHSGRGECGTHAHDVGDAFAIAGSFQPRPKGSHRLGNSWPLGRGARRFFASSEATKIMIFPGSAE